MSQMFSCPPPEEESHKNIKVSVKNKKKRKKKSGRKNGVGKNKRKHGKLTLTMSAWAENFTFAATWQLKHQLAYWKARAKALEYENGVLHDLIRKRNYVGRSRDSSVRESESSPQRETDIQIDSDTQIESDTDDFYGNGNEYEEQDDDDLEVSEEFIQFLQANAKYKEDARRERERLKAKNSENNVIEEMEAGPSECVEDKNEVLKKLYGANWQRISALEMSLESKFIHETDTDKPMYWPNIPFNFNFG